MSAKLPPVKDDPALATAREVRQRYLDTIRVAGISAEFGDLDRASLITAAYELATARINELAADWQGRVEARLQYLAGRQPIGPLIPSGSSPADREVLLESWRSAYSRASQADTQGRARMLADASRFGDTQVERAVLTVALDENDQATLGPWLDSHPDAAEELNEYRELSPLHGGQGFDALWVAQAFGPIQEPPQARQLNRLIEMKNVEIANSNRELDTIRRSRGPRSLTTAVGAHASPITRHGLIAKATAQLNQHGGLG